jgi:hypothetical protein
MKIMAEKKAAAKDLDFTIFSRAVAEQFNRMSAHTLFRVRLTPAGLTNPVEDFTKTLLWDAYQAAWPDGTNEIFRERREHDCQTCKQFIRAVGSVVTVVDGVLHSIWDVEVPEPYKTVAASMEELVKSGTIDGPFFHTERQVGTAKNFQQVTKYYESGLEKNETLTWNHFSVTIPDRFVVPKKDIGPKLADARATHDVLKRGLEELTLDAVDTVLELVTQNSLYRGEESKFALSAFRSMKLVFDRHEDDDDLFVWSNIDPVRTPPAVARIRNTAIGTLLIDLSAGMELEDAVKKFETSIMAPANYKRPTALVRKAMIEKARVKIDELGLGSALERRYATIHDITVNNILFADRSAKVLRGGRGGGKTFNAALGAPYGKGVQFIGCDVFAELAEKVPENVKKLDRVEEIGIEKFLKDVLPKATSLEVLFENRHAGNLVSLIAPVDPTAKNLFKWPNKFSWSYAGDVADSIKERVKRAGGSVVGDLCCRLAWDYADDLDFHMQEPGANHIYYGNVRRLSASGGMLDLDANGCDGMKAEPVENIFYADKNKMAEGTYTLTVNNYARRSTGTGFDAQVEFGGVTYEFHYDKALRDGETVAVAVIAFTRKDGFKIISSLPSTQTSKEVWGLQTQTFRKVTVVALSPNYWTTEDGGGPNTPNLSLPGSSSKGKVAARFAERLAALPGGVGNKHYFFMLDGCANEGKARGYYNEFLRADLEPHRKVMEMVGAKMRTDEAAHQLSGLGFSSTQRAELTVRVGGMFSRVVKVIF